MGGSRPERVGIYGITPTVWAVTKFMIAGLVLLGGSF